MTPIEIWGTALLMSIAIAFLIAWGLWSIFKIKSTKTRILIYVVTWITELCALVYFFFLGLQSVQM
jgi:hypothetical protein